jgi:hypothetical protein
MSDLSSEPDLQRFRRPSPTGGPLACQICRRFASSTTATRMWTPAHASKAPRAKQLPASLLPKRTAAFVLVLRVQTGRKSRLYWITRLVSASTWRNTRRQAPTMPPRGNKTVLITGVGEGSARHLLYEGISRQDRSTNLR